VLGVATAPPPATKPPTPPPLVVSDSVRLTKIGDFERPVLVTAPPGDTRDVFVVEQPGRIRVVHDGELVAQPFLDIRDEVFITNQQGLISLRVSPCEGPHALIYTL